MDVFQAFTLGTSGYLTLQSLPLLFTPRLIFSLLSTETRSIGSFEIYLSRTLGLTLLALAALSLLLSGLLPLSTSPVESTTTARKDPYTQPTVLICTVFHTASSAYLYANLTTSGWGVGLSAGLLFSVALTLLGAWTLVFGNEPARLSKTTGADKRTGNFPFRNSESAREAKKREKAEREGSGSGSGKGEGGKRRTVARTRSSRE